MDLDLMERPSDMVARLASVDDPRGLTLAVTPVNPYRASFDIRTHPAARGAGAATKGLAALVALCDLHGVDLDIWAEPDYQEDMPALLRLYERHGFKATGPTRGGAIRMSRIL